jgi:DNA-binding NarL/FixJ family response regulator
VLVLTAFMDSNLIHQALQAGAKGYLLKDAEQMDLIARVRQVLNGEMAFDPRVTRSLAEYAVEHPPTETDALLSPREIEILQLMAQGMTNTEIADSLFVSAATVKDYVRNVMTKLEARNRVDAVTRAVRRGLI